MGTMVQRKFPFFLIPFFIYICVHSVMMSPCSSSRRICLATVLWEMQNFHHMEHIIRASKAPFGWSALVSCRDLKSLTVSKRCRRMSLAAARRSTSCSGS